MEITKALEILEAKKVTITNELDAVNVAIDTLKNTFAPQFTVLENARLEVEAAQAVIEQKESALVAAVSEKEQLAQRVAELETVEVAPVDVIA